MTTKTVARDLLAAADYINEHGWCRNEFYDPKGRVCLAGAVGVVTGALAPTPVEKRTKLLKETFKELGDKQLADALAGKGMYADSYAWDWTKSKAARKRHGAAIAALATQINAERAQTLLREFDDRTVAIEQTAMFLSLSPQEQQERREQRTMARALAVQDIVTMYNDRNDFVPAKTPTETPKYKQTTKAQAVKLLQRAATA